MAKQKYDGIVESVRLKPDGQVDWVRAFERRGPTFSDYILINRDQLVKRLKAGKKFAVGRRLPQMASTFEVSQAVRLVEKDGQQYLVVGDSQTADRDRLDGVPRL
jgi:hypothetical protein